MNCLTLVTLVMSKTIPNVCLIKRGDTMEKVYRYRIYTNKQQQEKDTEDKRGVI